MKMQDGLIIKMNQAGVQLATFTPQTETWLLVTHPPGQRRIETEVPNDRLDQVLERLAAGDKIEGQQTTGTRG